MKSERNADFPLSFSGVRVSKFQQTKGCFEIWVEKDSPVGICPACGMVSDKVNDARYHSVIDRPVFAHNMTIWVKKRRFKCFNEDCGTKTFTEVIEGLRPGCFYTELFQDFAYSLTSGMTYTDTRRHLHSTYGLKVGLTTIYTCCQKRLRDQTPPQKPQKVRFIGLDEFSKGKNHDYGVVLTDLELRRIIDVGEGGKTKKAATTLLQKNLKLKSVAACVIDMWRPFKNAAAKLPNALVIVDKFHVIKKANEAMDSVRKRIQRKPDVATLKELLGKYKKLFRMGRERLSEKQEQRLWQILSLCPELMQSYEYKELLRDLYDQDDLTTAQSQLRNWITEASQSQITEIQKLAKTLKNWNEEILHYWNFRLTNAVTEGKVNKIKTLRRKAYNYNNFQSLRLKILEAER